ncbi:hypothetical protein RI367_002249 [Sorochytrium milnesiophthora]
MAAPAARQPRISSKLTPSPSSPFSFVIMDCPDNGSLPNYIPLLQAENVRHIVRISDGTYDYDTAPAAAVGISVHDDIKFPDGGIPDAVLVERWLLLLQRIYADERDPATDKCPAVAVHCVSGIGRAPLLVAIAFMESGLDDVTTIEVIRKHRRGALNTRQVRWLSDYKSRDLLLPGGGKKSKKKSPLERVFGKLSFRSSSSSSKSSDGPCRIQSLESIKNSTAGARQP